MTGDNEKTTVIASTRTAFEADAIAQALQAAGFDARVIDTATAGVWGGVGGALGQAKVIVLEHQAAGARAALSQIRFEGQSIDWDAVDVGNPVEPLMTKWSRSRRAMWTLALFILPPVGLVTLGFGIQHGDVIVQIMGGVALATAVVIVLALVFPFAQGSDADDSSDEGSDESEPDTRRTTGSK